MPGNFFDMLPGDPVQEEFLDILRVPGLRIERIVSKGHASAPGFWYEQEWDEWVMVLQGQAQLEIEGEPTIRNLNPGDYCWLPAGCRHRVAGTLPGKLTVWLAVHRGKAVDVS